MSSLRDLLSDPQFKAVVDDIEAEARRLGFKPSGGSFVAPVPKHSKLRRNRCTSRRGHYPGRMSAEFVPGRGPRKYRIKSLSETGPLENGVTQLSRADRIVWIDRRLHPTADMCSCKWSATRKCRRCRGA